MFRKTTKQKMTYHPTEKELQKWGEKITKTLYGFTKDDLEPLFERFAIPVYIMLARRFDEEPKWKIINRETDEEYTVEMARKAIVDTKLVDWEENK